MAANGAQFGVYTVHYYWIGAVPAMVFLGIVMMPFYYGSKVRIVPEYLRLRFNKHDAPLQRADVRVRDRPDRGREPLRAGARAQADARLADPARHRRRRRRRARLHHARRPLLGDLQRGAAVLRDPRGADPADDRRPARRRRLGRPQGGGREGQARRGRAVHTRGRAPGSATSTTRSAPPGSRSSSASASCSRSATGRRTSPRSSARCRPRASAPRGARR